MNAAKEKINYENFKGVFQYRNHPVTTDNGVYFFLGVFR